LKSDYAYNNREYPKEPPEEPTLFLFLLDLVEVTIRINVIDRIVNDIGISVVVLWVIWLTDERLNWCQAFVV